MVHERSGNLGETEKYLEKRVELDPERVDAWFRLGISGCFGTTRRRVLSPSAFV
jgi:hypothetical protein